MTEKTMLDKLNQNSVSLLKITVTEVEGQEIEVSRWRKGYDNSTQGRAQAKAEISEPYLTAIMAVWGDAPTVDESAAV